MAAKIKLLGYTVVPADSARGAIAVTADADAGTVMLEQDADRIVVDRDSAATLAAALNKLLAEQEPA